MSIACHGSEKTWWKRLQRGGLGRETTPWERHGYFAISLLSIGFTCLLFARRSLDDNRLTSWLWVFEGFDPVCLGAGLAGALGLAFLFSSLRISHRFSSAVLFFCFLALAVSFWSEPEVILDASRYITYTRTISSFGVGYFIAQWGSSIQNWTDLPCVPLLYGLAGLLFGRERVVFQLLNGILFSATAVLTSLMGKELWNRETGYTAGILMAGFPYLLTQVPLMLVDVPLTFLFTLSLYTIIRSLEKGSLVAVVSASASICAALWSKFSIWPLYSVLAVLPVSWTGSRRSLRSLAGIILAAGFVTGLMLLGKLDVMSHQVKLLWTYQWAGLSRWRESLLSTFLFQIHPFITIGACYSVYAAFKRRDVSCVPILWMVCIALALGSSRIRYLMPVFPLLALLAAYGMEDLRSFRLKKFAAMVAAVSSVSLALFFYLPFLQKTGLVNLRDAGEFLNRLEVSAVEVIPVSSREELYDPAVCVPLLDLYTEKNLVYREALYRKEPERSIQESSLRFTWEYRVPPFYQASPEEPMQERAVVIVSEGNPLPAHIAERLKGYSLAGAFEAHTEVFALKTWVHVYFRSE